MIRNTSNKSFKCVEYTDCLLLNARTELEDLQTVEIKVDNSLGCEIEGDPVVSTLEVHIDVSQLGVAHEKVILAQKALLVGCVHH